MEYGNLSTFLKNSKRKFHASGGVKTSANGSASKKMKLLNALNGMAKFSEFKLLSDLTPNTAYKILSAEAEQTRFGRTIILTLEDCKINLPKRMAALTDEQVQELAKLGASVIYKGKSNNANLIEFIEQPLEQSSSDEELMIESQIIT